jgi:hypothetical protein
MREDSMNHNEHLNNILTDARSIKTIDVCREIGVVQKTCT